MFFLTSRKEEGSSERLTRDSNNFDFLRLLGAALVIIAHSSVILYNKHLSFDPFDLICGINLGRFGVILFFVISGFLVTKSWTNKQHWVNFFLARFLRVYPAAIVVVLLSVFVLGLVITNLKIHEYLIHEKTQCYLQNTSLFRMYYYLPGVFIGNPCGSSVNGSLWTLPYEFTCYIFLSILGFAKLLRNRYLTLVVFAILIGIDIFFQSEIEVIVIPILGIDFKSFYSLWIYFMAGAIFYQFRNIIPLSFIGSILALVIVFLLKETAWATVLNPILIPYIIFNIAFSKGLPFNNIGKYGDFSYGMYLYAFPIQQLIVYFFLGSISLTAMIFGSLIVSFLFGVLSWFLIERPSLLLKNKLALALERFKKTD